MKLYGKKYLDDPTAYLPTEPKLYRIFMCKPPKGTKIYNKFEGARYVVGEAGQDIVLSGTAGELWCSPVQKVLAKYQMIDGTSLGVYIDEHEDGFDWIEVETVFGAVKNFALHIPGHEQFSLETADGIKLDVNHPRCEHGDGDFVVCMAGLSGEACLKDRWVLNGEIFRRTYTMTGELADLDKSGLEGYKVPRPTSLFK